MQSEQPMLQFAGIPTFMRAPIMPVDQLSPGMTAVMGVPTDYTRTGRAGARYGPRGIREASLHIWKYADSSVSGPALDPVTGNVTHYNPQTGRLADLGDIPIYPTDVVKTGESIRLAVKDVVKRDAFPVILGGDHFISYPAFQGFSDAVVARNPKAKIGYIQFDAHLDLWDSNPIMGKLNNATNARRVSELPMVDPSNMVWIGTGHSIREEQWNWIRDNGAHGYSIADVERRGMRDVVEEAWEHASKGCDTVYLTVDIDCVDSAWAPGTGTPNFHGIRPPDLLEAVEMLATRNIGAFDIAEVAPNLDPTEITQWLAATVVQKFIRPRL
ncbi:agmatinase family protein [Ruegeria sp. HKCCD8929]|uniref:agmatinase family protein n=1 Tax=Ruegeria sp. HKCCD8929 TaxID=2683006 RepID=UPI001487B149|nr:agmatinase family protein [Ruegeria sp. HKCCD8929]